MLLLFNIMHAMQQQGKRLRPDETTKQQAERKNAEGEGGNGGSSTPPKKLDSLWLAYTATRNP